MINLIVVVGFAVLAGWVGQQAINLSPALVGGIVVLCGASTYLGNRLAGKGQGR
jgi:hypothetical protein